jgi:putative MFS transporter
VFATFAGVAAVTGLVVLFRAPETAGQPLETLSP